MSDAARILLTDPRFTVGCVLAFVGLSMLGGTLLVMLDRPWRP